MQNTRLPLNRGHGARAEKRLECASFEQSIGSRCFCSFIAVVVAVVNASSNARIIKQIFQKESSKRTRCKRIPTKVGSTVENKEIGWPFRPLATLATTATCNQYFRRGRPENEINESWIEKRSNTSVNKLNWLAYWMNLQKFCLQNRKTWNGHLKSLAAFVWIKS